MRLIPSTDFCHLVGRRNRPRLTQCVWSVVFCKMLWLFSLSRTQLIGQQAYSQALQVDLTPHTGRISISEAETEASTLPALKKAPSPCVHPAREKASALRLSSLLVKLAQHRCKGHFIDSHERILASVQQHFSRPRLHKQSGQGEAVRAPPALYLAAV
jgi:hypothetical protein